MKNDIKPGSIFTYQGTKIKIVKLLSLETIIVEDMTKGVTLRVKTSEIIKQNFSNDSSEPVKISTASFSKKEWDDALTKYEIISPAIENFGDGTIVAEISKKHNKDRATIYRWIDKFKKTNSIISLIEGRGKTNKGIPKLDKILEEIIKEGIDKVYLKKGERKKAKKTIEYVHDKCKKLKIDPPHPNSIRNRINKLDPFKVTEARYGRKAAKEKFDPKVGTTPDADFALQQAQIDHKIFDIVLVDPIYRKPIGKPWLTTAIDIKTRMILGYYLSFDAPNFMSVGLCLICSLLKKDHILQALNIESNWPCWGVMKTLSTDNGKEFHSTSLKRACDLHHINLYHRPKGEPRFGGYIESFHKTLENEVHNLPGTTFSNVKERNKYPSEKRAALTFEEFEKWLVIFIVNIYHKRKHSTLGMAPIQAWEEAIVGTDTTSGIGYPAFPDAEKVRIEFMPIFHRTIQEYGISNQSIFYYSDVMKKWIHRKDPTSGKAKLPIKHEFRWDPRDLSRIYFFDPELKEYFPIPYRNLAHPTITIWELRAIKKTLKERGEKNIDENAIFRALNDLNEIEEQAIAETKKVRAQRTKARKKNSEKKIKMTSSKSTKTASNIFDEININDLKPFE